MLAACGLLKSFFDCLGMSDVARAATQVHQVDHRRGGTSLGNLIEGRASDAWSMSHPAVLDGNGEAEEPGFRQVADGLTWKSALSVNVSGIRRD